jgi:hypothetical protein
MAASEFDQIAEIYDETRHAPAEDTLRGIREMLEGHNRHSSLEIGIGTRLNTRSSGELDET